MGIADRLFGGFADMVASRLSSVAFAPSDDEALVKAAKGGTGASPIPPQGPAEDAIAVMTDPFTLLETLGYRERYSAVSYQTLLQLSYRVPIYPGILQVRSNQVSEFGKPQTDPNQPGFRIKMRDRKSKPEKKQRARMEQLEEWLEATGGGESMSQDSFVTYLKKSVRDTMIYDQLCTEARLNSRGVPVDFHAVDGGSIRIADADWEEDPIKRDDKISYVQVYDESVIAEFTPKQLLFAVRNPRSDLRVNGYGMSELEMGVNIITSLLFAYQYNSKYFTNGTVAKGMLNLPDVPDSKLRIFASQWQMIASGIVNAWRTPITNFKDAKWIDLYRSNREMEFSAWMDWNIKIFAAICGMDPAELNFNYGNSGQEGQMFAAPAEQKIKQSKDKGLRPLLTFIQDALNRFLIRRIDRDLMLEFTGLNPRDAGQVADVEKKQVTYLKTVDEIRAENDMPPLPKDTGKVLLDPQWMQVYMQQLQQEQQEQQQQAGGGDGEEGGPPAADGDGGEQEEGAAPGEDAAGGGDEEEDPPEEKKPPGMSESDWEDMLNESAAKSLRKARVTETRRGRRVRYDIDL